MKLAEKILKGNKQVEVEESKINEGQADDLYDFMKQQLFDLINDEKFLDIEVKDGLDQEDVYAEVLKAFDIASNIFRKELKKIKGLK